ncbi:MAG: DUF3293 domain-containing protein, partial [Bacteroidota bacterium]
MDDFSSDIDQRLHTAYRNTSYRILPARINIRIGEPNHALNEMLIDNNVFHWAFIAAVNPKSIRLSPNENQQRHDSLCAILRKQAYAFCEGLGIGDDAQWPPEQSVFVMDIDQHQCQDLHRKHRPAFA